ncbi:MAG: hypothetical protein LBG80_00690 [Bacteroidales bacterium]|jgi:hypothetical protein|nr:hypothetical protein [Bacteroidales bacterium]
MENSCISIWLGGILTVLSLLFTVWFLLKPLKTGYWGTFISAGFVIISVVCSFWTKDTANWLLTMICGLSTMIFVVLEKTFEDRKESYHFNKQYSGIQGEYEHLNRLVEEKALSNGKSLIEQCVAHSLDGVRFNMSKFYSYFLQDEKVDCKKEDQNNEKDRRKTFFRYNFKNAHDYIFLSNHKEIVYDEIFSNIFYNVYEKVSENFLAPLVFDTNTKVPEFISTELTRNILEIDGVKCQLNTSRFKPIDFYKNHKNSFVKATSGEKSRRIFIYDETFNTNFDVHKDDLGNEVKGLHPATNSMEIPFVLWLLEWHSQNNLEVGFIPVSSAIRLQHSKPNINSLDFSLTHIEKEDNGKKYIDVIMQIHGQPHKEAFYYLDINYYSLTAFDEKYADTNDKEAEHWGFFKELWNSRDNKINDVNNTILERLKASTLYTSLEGANKTQIDALLSTICVTTDIT